MVRQRDHRVKGVPAGYPGGKAGLGIYHRIINQIPPHDIYIELFLGGGAIMYYKRPARLDVGVDINSDTIAGSRPYLTHAELHVGDGLDYLRWLIAWEYERDRPRDVDRRQNTLHRPKEVDLRFTKQFQQRPARDRRKRHQPPFPDPVATIGGSRGARVMIYCDPPYLRSARRDKSALYVWEASDQVDGGRDDNWHTSLLNLLDALPYQVMLSGYNSPLYSRLLKAPKWRRVDYKAPIRGGQFAIESLWCNFPQPRELHDYRYLGENRRERERIKRKINRWKLKLKKMPDLERYAILGAIQETQQ